MTARVSLLPFLYLFSFIHLHVAVSSTSLCFSSILPSSSSSLPVWNEQQPPLQNGSVLWQNATVNCVWFGRTGGTHTCWHSLKHTQAQRHWYLHLQIVCSLSLTHTEPKHTPNFSFSRWSSSSPCLELYFDCLLLIPPYLVIVKPAWLREPTTKHVWSGRKVCAACTSDVSLQMSVCLLTRMILTSAGQVQMRPWGH